MFWTGRQIFTCKFVIGAAKRLTIGQQLKLLWPRQILNTNFISLREITDDHEFSLNVIFLT